MAFNILLLRKMLQHCDIFLIFWNFLYLFQALKNHIGAKNYFSVAFH